MRCTFPNRPILIFLLFPIPAKYFVMIIGGIAFLTAADGSGSVAATTHLGGLLVGYLYLQGGGAGSPPRSNTAISSGR